MFNKKKPPFDQAQGGILPLFFSANALIFLIMSFAGH
jgi:hypothetical protein